MPVKLSIQKPEIEIVTVFLIVSLFIMIIILIIFFGNYLSQDLNSGKNNITSNNLYEEDSYKKQPCILCGSRLKTTENIKSEEYKGKDESIVHTLGCPNCHGDQATLDRICPICKEKMQKDSYLIGRMWRKKSGKLHLHIIGCVECTPERAKYFSPGTPTS